MNGVKENVEDMDVNEEKLLVSDEDTNQASVESVAEEKLLASDDEATKDIPVDESSKQEDTKFNSDKKLQLVTYDSNRIGVNGDTAAVVSDASNAENIPPGGLLNGDVDDSSRCSSPDGSGLITKLKRVSEQSQKVALLKESLRSEEAKLQVLRKLLDSQRGRSSAQKPTPSSVKQSSAVPSLHPKQSSSANAHSGSSSNSIPNNVHHPSQHQPMHGGSKPAMQPVPAQPVQKYYIQVGNQLVPAPPPSAAGSSNQVYPSVPYGGSPMSSQSSYAPPPQPSKPLPPKQTPEQKQSAAKAALRRQLEQTLLQIPPPRPPSADWKAIPNVNSMDFMMLVGLDEVVDSILDIDGKPTLKNALSSLLPFNPRICAQCKVDFSPCWKTNDKVSKNSAICERCSLHNVKKDLKAEHTSRLKSAFLKALKQEQEIEERIKAGEDVNIGTITGSGEKTEQRSTTSSPITNNHIPNNHIPQPQASAVQTVTHSPSPSEGRHHAPSTSHHHRHQVVQHYPHHTSLVHQLHQQHIHQQQLELEPAPQRHSSSRWHPYNHHGSHGHTPSSHRQYVTGAGGGADGGHQEYYVVHHPQHSSARWQRT